MDYRNFTFQIHQLDTKRAWIRASSSQGEVSEQCEIPNSNLGPEISTTFETPDSPGWEKSLRDLRLAILAPGPYQDIGETLKLWGSTLFRFLFFPKALTLWERTRGEMTGHENEGIRIKLQLDLRSGGARRLASLPWELLYHEPSGGFLALDGRTPVIRYLDLPEPVPLLPDARPWRILVVAPEPDGVAPIDREAEISNLLSIWGEDDAIEPVVLSRATAGGIRRAIADGRIRIHGIHFLGHGTLDRATGEGGLLLEGTEGRAERFPGPRLETLLKGIPVPSVAVLNGCWTGHISSDGTCCAGAATALAKAGVPAVVAMQLPIRDRAAIHFSQHLFMSLQQGRSLDWATSEARLHLALEYPDTYLWAIPMLFTRLVDCRIVKKQIDPERRRHPSIPLVRTRLLTSRELSIYDSGDEGKRTLLEALQEIRADRTNVGSKGHHEA